MGSQAGITMNNQANYDILQSMEQELAKLKAKKVQHIQAYQKLQNSDSQNFFDLAKKYDQSSEVQMFSRAHQSTGQLSAEELQFRREPIHTVTQSMFEMCSPQHHNNIFQSYAFNTQAQAKNFELAKQMKQEESWLSDEQIQLRQFNYPDKCIDESISTTTPQCPTNKLMLHKAMT